MSDRSFLEGLLREMEIPFSNDMIDLTYAFYDMIMDKNKVMNLTAITEHDDFMIFGKVVS